MRGWFRRHFRLLAIPLLVAAVIAPAAWFSSEAQPEAVRMVSAPGHTDRLVTFTVDGRLRSYRLFVPPDLGPGRHGLLLALHSLHRTAAIFENMTQFDREAGANDTVVAYPDGVGRSWNAGTCCGKAVKRHVDDVEFLLRVVSDVQRRVPIDPNRIGVTGFSNGALMSYRLACERSDVFHVAVAVAGDIVGSRCSPAVPVSLLAVHGARDQVIPLAGEAWSHLDRHGFPSAASSIERLAAADDCTGATTTHEGGRTHWAAVGCASGSRVELVTSPTLAHHYPAGGADAARYGIDMSRLTWSFLQFAWPA